MGGRQEPPQISIDHRDAIKGADPLAQFTGLSLDFVTKMVPAPMAMFLAVDRDCAYRLASIKADPVLSPDPDLLGREYLSTVASSDPILEVAGAYGRVKLVGTEALHQSPSFAGSPLAERFLAGNGLGPVVALYMRDDQTRECCLLVLFRASEEPEFSDREKAFLRQVAPLLTQSFHTASGCNQERSPVHSDLHLTPREGEIAEMAATGARNEEIARALHISPGTVKCHIRNIYSKLGVDSRIHLSLKMAGH